MKKLIVCIVLAAALVACASVIVIIDPNSVAVQQQSSIQLIVEQTRFDSVPGDPNAIILQVRMRWADQ